MFHRNPSLFPRSVVADFFIGIGIGALIYSTVLFAGAWSVTFNPSYEIDLHWTSLPLYALFSAMRGIVAYLISLVFSLFIGYWAAKSKRAERLLIPMIDVFQSIPVLGFLPGLVLGLVALFPNSNVGLELTAILMIFTGQVWNMTLAFYSSIKSIPGDLKEATSIMGLSDVRRFVRLEFPYSAINLVWNSIISMAGGWFFLTICEAFTLGKQHYRLPGVGAYMAVAIERGDVSAMISGVVAMALIIILMDILLWRPALAWVHRFRLEETAMVGTQEHLINFIFTNSKILSWIRTYFVRRSRQSLIRGRREHLRFRIKLPSLKWLGWLRFAGWPALLFGVFGLLWGTYRLVGMLMQLSYPDWLAILQDTIFTLIRVFGAVAIATLWAVPVGIWLSRKRQRLRIAHPIAQLLASFPAPMLYPLVLGVIFHFKIDFAFGSMFLMLLGVQWYILFNTLAGGLRISKEIGDCMALMGSSKIDFWRYLYLPSVFPALVTGWVTAAGGAWNASIVAEYISYKGQTIHTRGLGALISRSTDNGDFATLSAGLLVMVIVVVLINRFVWDWVYRLAQTRFRLDM